MATIPVATTSINLKDKGIADLTGLDKLPATVKTLDISNTTAENLPTKNTFKHVKLGSGVTSLTMDKTNAFDMSEIPATVTISSAKDLEITTGDAKRIKKAAAGTKTEVVPTSLVKFPTNKTMQAPTAVTFGAKGATDATGTEITGSTAAKIDLPTGGKEGDYTLTFKFADAASSPVITGTVTKEYKIIDPSNLDKSALTSAITEASKLVEADYTPETWTDFKDMLYIAKQISTATEPLVTQEEGLKKSDYTEKTWQALQTALTAAKSALAGTAATEESVKAVPEALKQKARQNT